MKPAHITLHWDGKTLKLDKDQKSPRVGVYVSSIDNQKQSKLLEPPEAKGG